MEFICLAVHNVPIASKPDSGIHPDRREEDVYDLNDLHTLLAALKASLPFVAAAAVLFAGLLASAVAWIERYLTSHQQDHSLDAHSPAPEERARQIRALSARLKSKVESP